MLAIDSDRIVHRIVDETSNGYITQGDENESRDQGLVGVPYASSSNTAGVVVGYVSLWQLVSVLTPLSVVLVALRYTRSRL